MSCGDEDHDAPSDRWTEPLIAYHAALEDGECHAAAATDSADVALVADDLAEFEQAKACLRFLERCWPRHISQSNEPAAPAGPAAVGRTSHETDRSDASGAFQFGRFRILDYLGSGGTGLVFDAFDPTLARRVALKVPRLEVALVSEHNRRFTREAQATASLNHPNINTVYETGQVGPVRYIAAALSAGSSLARWLEQHPEPLSPESAAHLVRILAMAIDHAHERGILHRDLKPGNILLEPLGEDAGSWADQNGPSASISWQGLLPKLTDFGLAKVTPADSLGTRSGAVLGTPAYMSPEQALGRSTEITAATDVYSLGAILYELLVRRPPFQCESDLATLHRVVSEPIKPPRQFRADLPRDLEAICLKCLAKEPTNRYSSARSMADDLGRFLAGRATFARWTRWKRSNGDGWNRRRALLALGGAFGALATASGVAVYQRDEQIDLGRRLEYDGVVRSAYQAWQNTDLSVARQLLAGCVPTAGRKDFRGFEWYYVHHLCAGGRRSLKLEPREARCIAFSADGRQLFVGTNLGQIVAWSGHRDDTGREHTLFDSPIIHIAAHASDASLLAACDESGTIWWGTWSERHITRAESRAGGDFQCLAFAPSGQLLLAGNRQGEVMGWDVNGGRRVFQFTAHEAAVQFLAVSADGTRLATVSHDRRARVWRMNQWERPEHEFATHGQTCAVAFRPDGRQLATGGAYVYLWSLAGEHERKMLPGHMSTVVALAYSRDGQRLATAGHDRTIRVWDPQRSHLLYVLKGHTRGVSGVAFCPLNRELASASLDGAVEVWTDEAQEQVPIIGNAPGLAVLARTNAMRRLIAVAFIREQVSTVELRSVTDWAPVARIEQMHKVVSVAFFPQGDRLAICCDQGPIWIWDWLSDRHQTVDATPSPNVQCAVSADGRYLAVTCFENSGARLYDLSRGDVQPLPGMRAVCFAPNSHLLALEIPEPEHAIGLWSIRRRRLVGCLAGHTGYIFSLAFSPDERLLASGSIDGTARVWDVEALTERHTLRAHIGAVECVTFNPSGRSLLTGGVDGTIDCWNPVTGQLVLSLAQPAGTIKSLSFFDDDQMLVVSRYDNYDLATPALLLLRGR